MTQKQPQKPTICFTLRAEAAEARDDWARAAMWWNYAAGESAQKGNYRGNATACFLRQDAAKERDRRQYEQRIGPYQVEFA